MTAILIKFLSLPLYPLGFTLTLLLAGLFLPFHLKKVKKPLVIVSFCVLYLFSIHPVSRLLIGVLEKQYQEVLPHNRTDIPIVILGGGGAHFASFDHYPEINQAGDRILHGARLYKRGVSDRIIPTGGGVWLTERGFSEAHHHALILMDLFGIDSSSLILEPFSRNTYEHGHYVGAILDSLEMQREIILVTSASHMPRSVAVFQKHGFKVYTAPIDFYSRGKLIKNPTELFPAASALDLSTRAMHEYYGFIGYWILRWL